MDHSFPNQGPRNSFDAANDSKSTVDLKPAIPFLRHSTGLVPVAG